MKMESLEDVFIEELKDLYSAENQILKALPKMAKAATTPELSEAFEEHLEQSKMHVERLNQVMEMIGATGKKKCKGMEGLLEEGKEVLEMKGEAAPMALDAAIIAAAQRVEHYEIAAYGTLCTFAKILGHDDAAELLLETLNEEKAADEKLTEVAEQSVNREASQEEEPVAVGSRSGRGKGAKVVAKTSAARR